MSDQAVRDGVVGWGILGPGRIAARIGRALDDNRRGRLIAVASRDPERGRTFAAVHGAGTVYETYDALLSDDRIQAVYIALPNSLHAEWTVRALDAGKHVLCEKPLAMTVPEVDEVIAAAARNGRIAAEAFMYLHHPRTLRLLDVAASGELGDLQVISGAFSFFLTSPDDPRVNPELGGGSLWDVGCYPVSISRRIAGEDPAAIAGFARFDDRGVDRTFAGILRFPSGLVAHFESGFAAPDRERLEIVGSAATLVAEHPFVAHPDGPRASITIVRDGVTTDVPVEDVDQYRAEVDDLDAAILDGTEPRVSLAFSRGGIATLAALDAAARAADGAARVPA